MKLVEILARELEEWPDHKGPVLAIVQDPNMMAYIRASDDADEFAFRGGEWVGVCHNHVTARPLSGLATDHAEAIVTRADWEAERAKLKAPKADADGWIRHRGGKCPVEEGVRVDYRMRNGRQGINERSELLDWRRNDETPKSDIMSYRIHKPAEQPAPVSEETIKTTGHGTPDTMLAIRDRIRALDTHRAEVESTYQSQISEITKERDSLVHRLAEEGLALVEFVVQPVQKIMDWTDWRIGDVLTSTADGGGYTSGKTYKFLGMTTWGTARTLDDDGKENGMIPVCFAWHSRPAT